jgi:2'-5' RNA ligase
MKRLFFALDICDKDKRSIIEWRKQHLDNIIPINHPINENNLHITLAFLGAVNICQQIAFTQVCDEIFHSTSSDHFKGLPSISSFDLSMNQLQLFKKPKVLYLGFNTFPDTLVSLAEHLSKKAKLQGLFQEERSYCPHVSIARKVTELTHSLSLNIALNITSFSLYHSQSTANGIVYLPLNTWSLVLK